MFDTIGGLPAHPLMVHIPVVLLPLATIGIIAMVIRPRLIPHFGWLTVVLAGVGFVGTVLAAATGEDLEEKYYANEEIPKLLRDHGNLGETVRLLAALFFVVLLAWMLFNRWQKKVGEEAATAKVRKPKQIALALAVVAILMGGVATVTMTLTAHNGAKCTWDPDLC